MRLTRLTTVALAAVLTLAPPLLAPGQAAAPGTAQRPLSMAGRSVVYAPHGVVATSQPLATGAALAVLQRGGNAVDAAVTAAAVLSVVEPHMTGPGGDLFALLWSSQQERLVGLDASGRAGALMTPERIRAAGHTSVPTTGAGAVTLPGSVAGWATLLESHGTLGLG